MNNNEMTIRELNSLIETNLDAAGVLDDAMSGLQSSSHREMVLQMMADHTGHARQLQERVRELGGEPSTAAHATNVLKESYQKLWNNADDETAILLALRANERVAVDGLQAQVTKESQVETMSDEGIREHERLLGIELRHFRQVTERLREAGASVDNDDLLGAMRNAAEHAYAALNLSGGAVEAFIKWASGTTSER